MQFIDIQSTAEEMSTYIRGYWHHELIPFWVVFKGHTRFRIVQISRSLWRQQNSLGLKFNKCQIIFDPELRGKKLIDFSWEMTLLLWTTYPLFHNFHDKLPQPT